MVISGMLQMVVTGGLFSHTGDASALNSRLHTPQVIYTTHRNLLLETLGKHQGTFFFNFHWWHGWYTHRWLQGAQRLSSEASAFSQVCRDREGDSITVDTLELISSVGLLCLLKTLEPNGFLVGFHTFLRQCWMAPPPSAIVQTTHSWVWCFYTLTGRSMPSPPLPAGVPGQSIRGCRQSGMMRDISSNYTKAASQWFFFSKLCKLYTTVMEALWKFRQETEWKFKPTIIFCFSPAPSFLLSHHCLDVKLLLHSNISLLSPRLSKYPLLPHYCKCGWT